jgi:uncharacterized protein YndB with AHSA1/START domain
LGRIRVAADIDAPPADVWQVVESIERHVDWMADAVAIHFETTQRRGVGTRFVCETKVGPFRLDDHMVITSWDAGRAIGVDHHGVVSGRGQFTLTPTAGGTRFTWEEDLRFPWWLGGRLGELVGGRVVLQAIWRRNLRRLAELVEGSFTPPPAPAR